MADDATAKARAVAMVRFQEEEAADIANYTVLTNEMENSFEIVFVPRHPRWARSGSPVRRALEVDVWVTVLLPSPFDQLTQCSAQLTGPRASLR
jgi:hypothetical protein